MRAWMIGIVLAGLVILGGAPSAEAQVGVSCTGPSASASAGTSSPPTVTVTPPECTVTLPPT